jgi:DICT domain-containing protein
MNLTSKTQETLVRIYMGQNVRKEGILQTEVPDVEEAEMLLSKTLIAKSHWYLDQYLTTAMGAAIASKIVNERIDANKENFLERLRMVPGRVLDFCQKIRVKRTCLFSR